MSENEYVATAAAEKRLSEVLAERLGGPDGIDGGELAERLTAILLDGAKIEYKTRSKQVVISLDLPETATPRKPKAKDSGPAFSPEDTADSAAVPETVKAPPMPHITPFQPKQFAEPDYEDAHFD